MAKRRGRVTTPRRRKSKAINLLNLGESLIIGNIVSESFFEMNLWDFFTAGTFVNDDPWTGQGEQKISFRELIQCPNSATTDSTKVTASRFDVIKQNLKDNGLMMIGGLAITKVGSKVLRKQLRPTLNQVNNMIDFAGFKSMVKV